MLVARVDRVCMQHGQSKQLAHLDVRFIQVRIMTDTLIYRLLIDHTWTHLFFLSLASAEGMFSKQLGQ